MTTQMNSWNVIWKTTSHVEKIQQATSEIIANSIQNLNKAREGIRISSLGQKCAFITEYKRPHIMMMGLLEASELISSSYMVLFVRRIQSASPVAQKMMIFSQKQPVAGPQMETICPKHPGRVC